MVKKNDLVDIYIEDVIFPNKGIGYIDDQKVVVKGGIRDQKLQVRITKKRKSKMQGTILEVLAPSPLEIPAKCKHFGSCGGCSSQTLPYHHQLEMKAGQVNRILQDANIKDYEF